jgi:glycosyltransferase involved in cell wall biosynthesis
MSSFDAHAGVNTHQAAVVPPGRPRLVVVSHVLPFPRAGGQQQRVHYSLRALRARFHLTFATFEDRFGESRIRDELSTLCDEVLVLPPAASRTALRTWHRAAAVAHSAITGLKRSNYLIGQVHLSPTRVEQMLGARRFDCALFEYWHAAAAASVCRRRGMPTVLDMHDILWRALSRQMSMQSQLPAAWKKRALAKYRAAEERAWDEFDALIAINREEEQYVRAHVRPGQQVFYAPMGTDLSLWPYSYAPAAPQRVAYYGSLGSRHNQEDAMRCVREIMPEVWRERPDTELWLVGHSPPPSVQRLPREDSRIHVTGYVERVQDVLKTMSAVLCPWSGTYGFRSRLVEVMALGVPTVATHDAVAGMELEDGRGLALGANADELARATLRLLDNAGFAGEQSVSARRQVERRFSLADTYERLADELAAWIETRRPRGATAARQAS